MPGGTTQHDVCDQQNSELVCSMVGAPCPGRPVARPMATPAWAAVGAAGAAGLAVPSWAMRSRRCWPSLRAAACAAATAADRRPRVTDGAPEAVSAGGGDAGDGAWSRPGPENSSVGLSR